MRKNRLRNFLRKISRKQWIAVLLIAAAAIAVPVFARLAGAKTANGRIVPVTAGELERYNETFAPMLRGKDGSDATNPLSNFFTSYYNRPQDMNPEDFLRYFSPSEDVTDEAEFEALKAAENWPFGDGATLKNMPAPIHKFSADTVNGVLKKYMGITAKDLNTGGSDELIYLKKYDAYYNFTSDAGPAFFTCTSGEKQGDTVRLYGKSATLTLKTQGDRFLIEAYQRGTQQTKPERPPGLEEIPTHVDQVAVSIGEYPYFLQTLGEEENSADYIVKGTLLDDAKQKLQKDSKTHCGDYRGYTLSTFRISQVYKGNLQAGDNILLGESYYTINEDGKVTLHEVEYAPSAPNRDYVFFLKKEKDSPEFLHGFFTPAYKELGRYPVIAPEKASSLGADPLESQGMKLVQAGVEYGCIYSEVIDKYMK